MPSSASAVEDPPAARADAEGTWEAVRVSRATAEENMPPLPPPPPAPVMLPAEGPLEADWLDDRETVVVELE